MTPEDTRDQVADRRQDATVEDSFPASDPPANSGLVGPRGRLAHWTGRGPSHQRDNAHRPMGTPTHERHATETAHCWEDERDPTDR